MQFLTTGLDAEGRSCVVEQSDEVPAPMARVPGFSMDLLYATSENPPPSRPPGLADLVDVNLPPGISDGW